MVATPAHERLKRQFWSPPCDSQPALGPGPKYCCDQAGGGEREGGAVQERQAAMIRIAINRRRLRAQVAQLSSTWRAPAPRWSEETSGRGDNHCRRDGPSPSRWPTGWVAPLFGQVHAQAGDERQTTGEAEGHVWSKRCGERRIFLRRSVRGSNDRRPESACLPPGEFRARRLQLAQRIVA